MDSLTDQMWDLLWNEPEEADDYPGYRPLLAHYTSAFTAEAILKGKQFWLSHPILMNDVEELRWGIHAAERILLGHKGIEAACGTPERFECFVNSFQQYIDSYGLGHARSIFIACFSRHESDDHDGLLSMWRAYGSNGEGVALVFDTGKIIAQEDSPFVLGPVRYCYPDERKNLITTELEKIAEFLEKNKGQWGDEFLQTASYFLLEKIKLISLTTKHHGFREEKEWRLIYFPERDQENKYEQYIGYASGVTGFQPKLKIPFDGQIPGIPNLSEMISEILLGPSHGSELAVNAFERMLDLNKLSDLKNRVRRSSIPFRSRGL
jgi:Protein of unknown function (DUF2971)